MDIVQRRQEGSFFTPPRWAQAAHRLLARDLGETWFKDWVVWDPACGTKNLTKDIAGFSSLYLSTLHEEELADSASRNPEATSFVYDFLNQDIRLNREGAGRATPPRGDLPEALYQDLLADRPVLFLMNPPYATSTNQGASHKSEVSLTQVRQAMLQHPGYSHATQQLYTQFLFRVQQLKADFALSRVAVGIFSNERFLTGGKSFGPFLDDFCEDFSFRSGFFFRASEFEQVADTWGISFTLWDSQATARPFDLQVLADISEDAPAVPALPGPEFLDLGIKTIGWRRVRPVSPGKALSDWVKEFVPRRPLKAAEPYVRLSNALQVNSAASPRGSLAAGAFGFFQNNSDSVEHSGRYVALYSSAFGSGNGVSVTEQTFTRCAVAFAVRKATFPDFKDLWVTGHDLFSAPIVPDEADPAWLRFVYDCVVFSLASRSGSRQSALRRVDYLGQELDVLNEFFFLPSRRVTDLAEDLKLPVLAADLAIHGKERFVSSWLEANAAAKTSSAKRLLACLEELVALTMPLREDNAYVEEFQLTAWDAGFWQLLGSLEQALKSHSPILDTPKAEAWQAEFDVAFKDLKAQVAQQAKTFGFCASSLAAAKPR
ncbi:hypothetical protein BSR28_00345 [Boudabousia liubingyangii]|nr:hypothetical protein BSR28_00345 [Boudabousia liubingyangii]